VVARVGAARVAPRLRCTDIVQQASENRVGLAQVRDRRGAGDLRGYGCPSAPPGTPEFVE
jgi:hypothetical protein